MDRAKAATYERLFKGKLIDRFEISDLINHGKSAAVFRSTSGGEQYAVKIFDTDFDDEIEGKRIEQEMSLKGHGIRNLVEIIDGGKYEVDGESYYYVVMPLLDGKNLKQHIQTEQYDQNFIAKVTAILLQVTEQLLAQSIVHRDIKPENIQVTSPGDLFVMDLGVLKFVGNQSFTDNNGKQFVGTHRYSPPEFIRRNEEDSESGWRAVNLYQIGGVLHDLIMRKDLFSEATPQANLIVAILEQKPDIENPSIDARLISLAQNLLAKDWKKRLEYSTPDSIKAILDSLSVPISGSKAMIEEAKAIKNRAKTLLEEVESLRTSTEEKEKEVMTLLSELKAYLSGSLHRVASSLGITRVTEIGQVPFQVLQPIPHFEGRSNPLFRLEAGIKEGFLRPFLLIAQGKIDFDMNCLIGLHAILPSGRIDLQSGISPIDVLSHDQSPFMKTLYDYAAWNLIWPQIEREITPIRPRIAAGPPQVSSHKFQFFIIFNGIIAFNNDLKELLDSAFSALLLKIMKLWEPKVAEAVKQMEKEILQPRVAIRVTIGILSLKTLAVDLIELVKFLVRFWLKRCESTDCLGCQRSTVNEKEYSLGNTRLHQSVDLIDQGEGLPCTCRHGNKHKALSVGYRLLNCCVRLNLVRT
jgi:serine/threonine protein kinase